MTTEREALDLIRATATRSVPNCINLVAIDRILAEVAATPAPLADAELAELVRLEALATKGPWVHAEAFFVACPRQYYIVDTWERQTPKSEMRSNAALIAAMRNALLGLLARLTAAEAKMAELPKLQEFVSSLLNDLLNHPEIAPSIHAKLWQLRQQLTVKGGQQDA